jgi:hypothetical protein
MQGRHTHPYPTPQGMDETPGLSIHTTPLKRFPTPLKRLSTPHERFAIFFNYLLNQSLTFFVYAYPRREGNSDAPKGVRY